MKLSLLLSKGFITGLVLLLLNDFLLKSLYGNWLTGKLSDFAGLFIFPIFLTTLFPKAIRFNYVFTLLFFIYWKTPLSQSLFDLLAYNGLPLCRVVDYTDFIAFISLPLSYRYIQNIPTASYNSLQKGLAFSIAAISFFSFVATSPIKRFPTNQFYVDKTYKSGLSPVAFLDSIRSHNINLRIDTAELAYNLSDTFYIAEIYGLPDREYVDTTTGELEAVRVKFSLKPRNRGSKVHLIWVQLNKSFIWDTSKKNRKLRKQAAKLGKKFLIEELE